MSNSQSLSLDALVEIQLTKEVESEPGIAPFFLACGKLISAGHVSHHNEHKR